jgi:AmmeMemoRadiSam system protein B
MIRKPAVAGQFYPASPEHLKTELKRCMPKCTDLRTVIGVISPHAGYIYSGPVAGAVFSAIVVPKKVIVLSPNHTGLGRPAAIMTEGEWETPLGGVKIDTALAKALVAGSGVLEDDMMAHAAEHSLEVQLPFLQARRSDFRLVPITVSHLRFEVCEQIGRSIAKAVKDFKARGEDVLIVASSDMTHYEPHDVAKKKDRLAIDKALVLDAKGLLDTCARERITMCGVVPSAIMLIAARELGAKKGELIKYATSGEVSGDLGAVVGYAGMIFY